MKTAQNIAGLIGEHSHQLIWKEQQRYWRTQFHELINPKGQAFPAKYYAESPKKKLIVSEGERDPISMKSIAVLHHFIEWPGDEEDPITNEPAFTAEELHHMVTFGPRDLGRLLQKVKKILAGDTPDLEHENTGTEAD